MSNQQLQAETSRQTRNRKVSPELSEFLHMLDALESHMDDRETETPRNS